MFSWAPPDITRIDARVVCNRLTLIASIQPIIQRKCKMGDAKKISIDKEVRKLKEYWLITEIKYFTWLVNTMLVRKTSRKWIMCVAFTDLNLACPKDPCLLPNIDRLTNWSLMYKTLSFVGGYFGMDPLDASKTAFMSNNYNYYSKSI